jgi:hypothetical protein
MYAQAVFLEASHAHLPIHLDYPLRPRSLREDLAGAVTLLRAQALVYRRALAEADDLVDRTMRHALADLDAAVFYRCEMDWLFDVMRRLAVPSGPH